MSLPFFYEPLEWSCPFFCPVKFGSHTHHHIVHWKQFYRIPLNMNVMAIFLKIPAPVLKALRPTKVTSSSNLLLTQTHQTKKSVYSTKLLLGIIRYYIPGQQQGRWILVVEYDLCALQDYTLGQHELHICYEPRKSSTL